MADLPGEPRDHMDALLRFLVPSAQRWLDEAGAFRPFGASMAPDGQLQALTPSEEQEATAQDQLDLMRAEVRLGAERGSLLAIGICSDVTLPEGDFPEAIRIELEHRDAAPITCVVPYRPAGGGGYEYGSLVTAEGERRTWTRPS
jgi:hypothetical protein